MSSDLDERDDARPTAGDEADAADGAPSRRSRWWWLALVPVVAFAVLLASGLGRDPRVVPTELVGREAPTFRLPMLDGSGALDLASLRGQVVVVNFWASWCHECRLEHDALVAAWGRYRDRGVVLVGVDFEDTADAATAYSKEMGGDWPIVTDPGSRTAIAFGVFGVPETYVVGPDGSIIAKRVGAVDYVWLTDQIERALRAEGTA